MPIERIDRVELIRAVRSGVDVGSADLALRQIEGLSGSSFAVGASTARSFRQIITRRFNRSAETSSKFAGWEDLKLSLQGLGPDTAILGVALPGGGSVVFSDGGMQLIGCLVRVDLEDDDDAVY